MERKVMQHKPAMVAAADGRDSNQVNASASGSNPHVSVLSSWKEIAAYLGKGVRTVQRWEVELELPVHRPVPGSRRIVITTKEELAAWLVHQQTRAQASERPIPSDEFRRMKALVHDTLVRADLLRKNAEKLIEQLEKSRAARGLRTRQRSARTLAVVRAIGSAAAKSPEHN